MKKHLWIDSNEIKWDIAILEFDLDKIVGNSEEVWKIHKEIIETVWNLLHPIGIKFSWTHDIEKILLNIPSSDKELVNDLLVNSKFDFSRIKESVTWKDEIYVPTKNTELLNLLLENEQQN